MEHPEKKWMQKATDGYKSQSFSIYFWRHGRKFLYVQRQIVEVQHTRVREGVRKRRPE